MEVCRGGQGRGCVWGTVQGAVRVYLGVCVFLQNFMDTGSLGHEQYQLGKENREEPTFP